MIKLLEVIQSLLNKCRPMPTAKPSLQVLGFGDDAVWVTLLKSGHNLWVQKMDAIQLVPKSYPTGDRRQKDKSREVRIRCLSLACSLLKQQHHTSWAGRCAAVRKVRSSWFQARVSRSCRRSHLVCDWLNVPGAEHLICVKELGVCYLPGLGRRLPLLRSHRSPNLC